MKSPTIAILLPMLAALGDGLASPVLATPNASRSFSVAPLPPEARVAEGFDAAESGGVFVGVGRFDDSRFPEVLYAPDDAVDLAHLFALELELIAPENVVVSLAGDPRKGDSAGRLEALLAAGAKRAPATQAGIYDLLDKRGRATGPRGLFVVAIATHGFTEKDGDFLLGADSLGRYLRRTGIAAGEVFDLVSQAVAPRRIVMIDACRERRSATRGGDGSDPAGGGPAMSQAFADAIAQASGQAVLFGATRDGYAYDDTARGNGVFAAAVLDGLRGQAAPADGRFITVAALADFVNRRVTDWVRVHRPEHVSVSRGISRQVEGAAAKIPLAVNTSAWQDVEEFRQRRLAGLVQLRDNIGGPDSPGNPVTGTLYDEIRQLLRTDFPGAAAWDLLGEVEALDATVATQRSLVFYVQQHREALAAGARSAAPPHTVSPAPRADRPRASAKWKDPVVGLELSFVPAGSFRMGSPLNEAGRDDDETPHWVTLAQPFWIADKEVTQLQYARFVAETGYVTDAEKTGSSQVWENSQWQEKAGVTWRDSGGPGDGSLDRPVVHVSWNDAAAFCEWLSRRTGKTFRLPTEAEWEYAARAGTTTAAYAGELTIRDSCDVPELEEIAWYCGNSAAQTHPVGEKRPNAWGLYDMLGNAMEWVADWSGAYEDGPATDPRGPDSGHFRLRRGGSAFFSARGCRAADRGKLDAGEHYGFLGFRVVRAHR